VLESEGFLSMIGRRSNPVKTSSGDLFPVPIENQIDQMDGVVKSAYFQLDKKIILAYEGASSSTQLIQAFFREENLPLDEIKHISSMPMDARHRCKIELASLKKEIHKGQLMNVTHSSPLSHRLLAYTNERFPLVPILLFVFLLTSGYSHLFANWLNQVFNWQE